MLNEYPRTGARKASPHAERCAQGAYVRVGWLTSVSRVAAYSQLKNAHHPLLTPFQGAFADPIPLTGTVSFAWSH